jgi:hypothetical protein
MRKAFMSQMKAPAVGRHRKVIHRTTLQLCEIKEIELIGNI